MSKQFTIVVTDWPGFPKIAVVQVGGGLPSLTKKPTGGETEFEPIMAYSPINAKSSASHEAVEPAAASVGGMTLVGPRTL